MQMQSTELNQFLWDLSLERLNFADPYPQSRLLSGSWCMLHRRKSTRHLHQMSLQCRTSPWPPSSGWRWGHKECSGRECGTVSHSCLGHRHCVSRGRVTPLQKRTQVWFALQAKISVAHEVMVQMLPENTKIKKIYRGTLTSVYIYTKKLFSKITNIFY